MLTKGGLAHGAWAHHAKGITYKNQISKIMKLEHLGIKTIIVAYYLLFSIWNR